MSALPKWAIRTITRDASVSDSACRIMGILVDAEHADWELEFTNDTDGSGANVFEIGGEAEGGGTRLFDFSRLGGIYFPTACYVDVTGTGITATVWIDGTPGSDPVSVFLVEDTFTDTNGTALSAHAPDTDSVGNGWAVVDGSSAWTIQSDKAACSGVADQTIEIDSGSANVIIKLSSVIPGSYFSILARGDGTVLDYVMAQIQTAEDLLVIAYNDGSYHVIDSVAYVSTPTGEIVDYEFRVNGTALEIWIGGVLKLAATSSYNLTNTKIGLGGYNENGTQKVDGLTVTAL